MSWVDVELAALRASTGAVELAANWLIQSSLLLVVGLGVGWSLRNRGSAAQSAVYRMTLLAALLCPLATWILSLSGVSGWSIAMPDGFRFEQVHDLDRPGNQPLATAGLESIGQAGIAAADLTETVRPARPRPRLPGTELSSLDAYRPDVSPPDSVLAPVAADSTDLFSASQPVVETVQVPAELWVLDIHAYGLFAVGVFVVWSLVSLVLSIRLALAWRSLARLRRRAHDAEQSTVDICRQLAARIGVTAPQVVRSPYLPSPCLAGLRRPAVLLPDEDQSVCLRDLLVHELAHLRRHDCHWNLLRRVATAFFFFQPLLWRLSRLIETTAEEVCDDYVVQLGGDRTEYAHRLVNVAELSAAPIATAGVGIVSLRSMLGQRVQRILDTSRSLSTRVGNALVVAVISAGLVSTVTVGLVGLDSAAAPVAEEGAESTQTGESSDPDRNPTHTETAEQKLITVRGTIVDAQGNSIANATVRTVHWNDDAEDRSRIIEQCESDEAGRFSIGYPEPLRDGETYSARRRMIAVIAYKQGFSPDGYWTEDLAESEPLRLVLAKDDMPMSGQLVDLEGQPLSGVKVGIQSYWAPKGNDLSQWVDAVKQGAPPWSSVSHLRNVPFVEQWLTPTTLTDGKGKFTIAGVGRQRKVNLVFEGPTVARTAAQAVTCDIERMSQPLTVNRAWQSDKKSTVIGTNFRLTLPPTKIIQGVVRDAATGQPMSGVGVQSWRFADTHTIGERHIRTETDEQGRFRLVGMPKGAGNQVVAVPSDDQPYLMRVAEIPDSPGMEPVDVAIELHRGIWITGRATDKSTGEPVPDCRIYYLPFRSNPHAQALPEFGDGGNVDGTNAYQDRYLTDTDGHFRLVGLPGRAIVGIQAIESQYRRGYGWSSIEGIDSKGDFDTYRNPITPGRTWPSSMKEINPAAGTETVNVDLQLDPGGQVEVSVLDSIGQPISGVSVTGINSFNRSVEVDTSEFKVITLGPDETRTVLLHHPQRNLGKVVRVHADRASPRVSVRLQRCAKVVGQLVDGNGVPVTGSQVRLAVQPGESFGKELPRVSTNGQGRFEHRAVLPGASYAVTVESTQVGFRTIAENLAVSPGETIDLGSVDVTSDEQPEPVRLTAKAAAPGADAQETRPRASESQPSEAKQPGPEDSNDQTTVPTFAGTVVDPSGKPVAGARLFLIHYVPEPTGLLEPTWQPIAVTNEDGAFRFSVETEQFGVHATSTGFGYSSLVATKPGFGFAWSTAGVFETSGQWQRDARERLKRTTGISQSKLKQAVEQVGQPLRLVKDDTPIRGRILDIDGQPVAGARLMLMEVTTGLDDDLTPWRQAAALPKADYYSARRQTPRLVNGQQVRSLVEPATTDKEGRFAVHGVGQGRICELLLTGPGIESTKILIRTEVGQPIELDKQRDSPYLGTYTYHPAEFSLVAGPSIPIVGRVRDSTNGAPIAGATIKSQKRHGEPISGRGQDFVRAVTDQQGRYRLEGMPVGRDNRIAAIAPDGEVAYMPISKRTATKGDQDSVEVNFDLARGLWLTGQVTDGESGKGLSGQLAYYVPKESPHYRLASGMNVDQRDRLQSDRDGKFRIAALPGPGLVAFQAYNHEDYPRTESIRKADGQMEKVGRTLLQTAPWSLVPHNYHLVVEIDPTNDAQQVNLDLRLDGGRRVTGRVVDPSGNPVADYYYTGRLAQFGSWEQAEDGVFVLQGYDSSEPRHVYVVTIDHQQAGYLRVAGPVSDERVVRLVPAGSVSGRLVDQDGTPLGNHSLHQWYPRRSPTDQKSSYHSPPLPRNLPNWRAGQYETDDRGQFRITGLVPGIEYRISARDRQHRPRPMTVGPLETVITVQPGKDKDLGDVAIADQTEFHAEAMRSQAGQRNTQRKRKAGGAVESKATQDKPAAGSDMRSSQDRKQVLTFRGKIVDPIGNPADDARLFIVTHRSQASGLLLADHEPLARTAADGSFEFSVSEEDLNVTATSIQYAPLVAVKRGYGFAWSVAGRFETTGRWLRQASQSLENLPPEYDQPETLPDFATAIRNAGKPLALVPDDVPIRGQIVDINGQAVAGARLTLIRVWGGNNDDLSAWRRAAAEPTADYYSAVTRTPRYIAGPETRSIVEPAVTDDRGRFTLRGLGRGRIAKLILEGPGIATDPLFVRTEVGDKIALLRQRSKPTLGSYTYYASEFRVVAGPSTPIVGIVRDKESGAPIAGVTVKSQTRQGEAISGWGQDFVRALTDANGRYRLEGMPIGDDNRIAAIAPRHGRGYFSHRKRSPTKPGSDPTRINFELQAGIWVTGRVTDKDSGAAIFGRFVVHSKQPGPEDPRLNSFGRADDRELWMTGRDGRFRILAMRKPGFVWFVAQEHDHDKYPPAKGVLRKDGTVVDVNESGLDKGVRLRIEHYIEHHNVVAEIDPAADAQQIELNLQLEKALSARLKVVGPEGEAVTGLRYAWRTGFTSVGGRARHQYFWEWCGEPTVELKNYDPDRPRFVYLLDETRALAGRYYVSGTPDRERVVRLQPAGRAKGRLVDEEGEPLAGFRLIEWQSPPQPSPFGSVARKDAPLDSPPLHHSQSFDPPGRPETDREGRFEIVGLVPGLDYRLQAIDRHGEKGPTMVGPLDVVIQVKPGQSVNLGDIKIADPKQFETVATAIETSDPETPTQRREASRVPGPSKRFETSKREQSATVEIGGVVHREGGIAVGNADVAVIAMGVGARRGGDLSPDGAVLAEAKTDAEGRFLLPLQVANSAAYRYPKLVARKPGFGLAWKPIDLDVTDTKANLLLPDQQPVRGRLVDLEGQPAAGVTLHIRGITRRLDGAESPSRDGVGFEGPPLPRAWLPPVTSDDQGEFAIDGVPKGCGLYLAVARNDRFAQLDIALNTGMPEQRTQRDMTYRSLVRNVPANEVAVLTLAPAQLFEGTVRYEDTGEVAPHARLSIWASQQKFGSMASVAAVADAEGRYRLSPKPGIRFGLTAYPPLGTPYLPRRTPNSEAIWWRDGDTVRRVDMTLPRGILVRGKVVDAETGEPIIGASIQYVPEEANNPHTADDILTGWQDERPSREDGTFEIVVLPGPGRLLVYGPSGKYVSQTISGRMLRSGEPGGQRAYAHAIQVVNPDDDQEEMDVTIRLKSGHTVAGQIIDEQGTSVDEVLVISRYQYSPLSFTSLQWRGQMEPTRGGQYEISGLQAGEDHVVHFLDPNRRIGATKVIRVEDDERAVVLQPCGSAKARLVDQRGDPHAGTSYAIHMVITPGASRFDLKALRKGEIAADEEFVANIDRTNYWPGPKTDADGFIVFPALIPGATYRLMSNNKDGDLEVVREFNVEPGQTIDLGELTVKLKLTVG